jgi:peroxiredoxin
MRTILGIALIMVLAVKPDRCFADSKLTTPVGRKVEDFKLRDYRGAERSLQEFSNYKAVVVAFLGAECPLAKQYGPRLVELAKEFEPRGVAFVGIDSNQQDSISAITRYAREAGINFPILKDVGNGVADRLGAQRTPEVFLVDADHVVRYCGRIDDQFGIGYVRTKPGRRDLAIAIDEVLTGKPVTLPQVQAPGCFIGRVRLEVKNTVVTYAKDVAPILQKHCVECHHAGAIAPFSLTSYEETIGWVDTIRQVLDQQRMPPWHANPLYGHFANDSRLPERDKKLIEEWIDNGAPEGDPKDLPKSIQFVEGWRIPKPDLILSIPKPYHVPAQGTVPYEFIVVDPGFKEDKWVRAAEIRPSNRGVVHHVLVFVQPPGGERAVEHGPKGQRGFITHWLAGMVPGSRPMILPEGQARRIPAGSRLLFQIHYTVNGTPQTDQTSMGLVFADPKTVRKEVTTEMVFNPKLLIPPGVADQQIEGEDTIAEDTLVLSMTPHTHVRGKAFRFEATYPDGKQEILLDVPHYDFNWQNTYVLATPKLLPKGTRLHCVAHYDNSADNPSNPDPDAQVRWGEQTWEEMMIGYYEAVHASQNLVKEAPKSKVPAHADQPAIDSELKRLAERALASQKDFDTFAVALRKIIPCVDRVCLSTYSKGKLHVEWASYPGDVEQRFASSGFEAEGRGFMLVGYALFDEYSVVPDLKGARGLDMSYFSRALSSSVHVPVAVEGRPGSLNLWSKEKDAFGGKLQPLLEAIARALSESKKE